MKKKIKSINSFITIFLLALLFSLNIITHNVTKAVEIIESDSIKNESVSNEVPEVTVQISGTGLQESENLSNNILTEISDALLPGHEVYTTDSKTSNDFNGVKPGDDIIIDIGCIPVDSDGNRITSLEVTLQSFINTDKAGVIDGYCENLSTPDAYIREVIANSINSSDDVLGSIYGTYIEKEYKTEIRFGEDGKAILHIPEDCPDNYVLAITQMVNPETGYNFTLNEAFRLFLALGDGSNSDPANNANNPGNRPNNGNKQPDDEDDGHRYYSKKTELLSYDHLNPNRSGSISSNKYDVSQGIPTSENLDYSITADNALYNITTRKTTLNTGVKDITIKLYATYTQHHTSYSYNKSGDKIVRHWTTTERVSRTVTTDYSYSSSLTLYDVPASQIYPVLNGSLQAENNGNILSSGGIILQGSLTPGGQTLTFIIRKPSVSNVESANIGHFGSYSSAMSALNSNNGGSVKSRINSAVIGARSYSGSVNYSYQGLKVSTMSHNYTKPVVAKVSGASTKLIPATYPNGLAIGSGNVKYTNGNFGIIPNNIVVHTPVINNSYISSTSKFINQKINIDTSRKYLMLDEQFTITIPDSGMHNNIKGYGNRTYNTSQGVTGYKTTWGKIKDVKLPFDAYLHYTSKGKTYKYFIKANTWLSESGADAKTSLTVTQYTYTIPVWVTEKTYNIETRVIAENAINSSMYELQEANKNSSVANYVASQIIPVEIIGKIYDLRVSASNDPGWNSIFSWKNQTNYIAADEFPFGAQGQNKNTAYKYAPKLGYTFVFDFKTKGTKSNNIDVSVQPEGFYFVSRDGKKTQEVDLYYNTISKSNIKITSQDTNIDLTVNLRNAYMKVASQEFIDSSRIYNNKYNYSLGVKVGNFAKMNLPESLRMCYNNFAEYVNALYGIGATENSISKNAGNNNVSVGKDKVIGSVGHWYAGYRLSASTKAIPKGSDINIAIKNNSFLTDGYIVVKFDIKTKYQNSTGNYDYLQYMGPEGMNEAGDNTGKLLVDWTKDRNQTITLPNGNTAEVPVGSVAIFDASLRSSNDAEVGGTH